MDALQDFLEESRRQPFDCPALLESIHSKLADRLQNEPDLLMTYYADDYPDVESDVKEQDASEQAWIPW